MRVLTHIPSRGRFAAPVAALLAGLALSGCQTYSEKNAAFHDAWRRGDFEAARASIARNAAKAPARDKVVFRLEEGTALRILERYEASDRAFLDAERRIESYEDSARLRVGAEAGGALSNQANRPYVGFASDKIMLSVYLALNRIALGDFDGARVELNRAYDRQRLAVEDNARRIESARQDAADQRVDVEGALHDPGVRAGLSRVESSFQGLSVYSDYVNPFATYLQMIFLIAHAAGGSDVSTADNLLQRLHEMAAGHPALGDAAAQIQALRQGRELAPCTYMIVETGMAPKLEQERIDIPLLLVDQDAPYIGAAFPYLVYHESYASDFFIKRAAGRQPALLIADMDRIVRTDFKNRYPAIVNRTIASSAVKAVGNVALENEAGALGAFLGAAYQAAVNIADTRCWTTLPKHVLVARIPTPEDRKVAVEAPSLGLNQPIILKPARVNVVYVKSISRTAPIVISQFALK